MKKIITTVGTSLFTNFMDEKVKSKYGGDYASISIESAYMAIENAKASAVDIWSDLYKHHIRTIQENIEDFWFDDVFKDNIAASAEIASLFKIAEQEEGKVLVHLIATDTLLSVLAAELIVIWFERHKHLAPNVGEVLFKRVQSEFNKQSESNYVVKSLKVERQDDYEEGFMNLFSLLESQVEKEVDILNITGGYKGIVPLLTLFGQVWKVEIKYLFQEKDLADEKEIISIGDLPFHFDSSFAEMYGDFITKEGLNSINEKEEVIETLLNKNIIYKKGNKYKRTPLGTLFSRITRGELDSKKSFIGYYYEFALFEYFSKQESTKTNRSVTYWWNRQDNTFHNEPQFEKNADREQSIEIDLVVKSASQEITWYEIKSWSSMGLRKAKKQLLVKIDFLQSVKMEFPKRFTLLLYKLPHIELDYKKKILKEIHELASSNFEEFTIDYVEAPMSNKDVFNYKKLSDDGIKEVHPLVKGIYMT